MSRGPGDAAGPLFLSPTREGEDVTEVIIGENDRVEWAIKDFRRKVQRSGVLKELRKKRFYVKPSAAKRKKAEAAARRRRSSGRRGR